MERFIQTKIIPELTTIIESKFRELPEYLAEELQIEKSDVSVALTKFYGEVSKKMITTTLKKTEQTSSVRKSGTPSPVQNKEDKISQYKLKISKSKIKEGYLNLDSGRAVKKNESNLKKFDFNETLNIALPKSSENYKIFATLNGEEPGPQTLAEKKITEKPKEKITEKPKEKAKIKTPPQSEEEDSSDEEKLVKVTGLAAKKAGMTSKISPTPVAKTPVAKTPVAKTPVAKTPVAKTPVAKTPVAKTPVAKTPVKGKYPVVKLNDSGVLVDNKTNFVWDDEPDKCGKIIGVWNSDEDDHEELDEDDIKIITKNKWDYDVKQYIEDTDEEVSEKDDALEVASKISNLLRAGQTSKEKVKQMLDDDDDNSDFSDDE